MTGSKQCKTTQHAAVSAKCAVSYYAVEALCYEGPYWYAYFYPYTERRPV